MFWKKKEEPTDTEYIENLINQIKAYSSLADHFKAESEKKSIEIEDLKRQLTERPEVQDKSEELEQLEADKTRLKEELAEKTKEIVTLQEMNKRNREENQELYSTLKKTIEEGDENAEGNEEED